MAGIAHLGFAFGAKPVAPKVPLIIFIVAAELLDILWFLFYIIGIENLSGTSPWSHGLFMSVIWSILAGSSVGIIFHSSRAGIVTGTIVFSHWILDLITHPMGAILAGHPLPPDLPLLFNGSPMVGLGLYNHSAMVAYLTELILTGAGLPIYFAYKKKAKKTNRRAAGV